MKKIQVVDKTEQNEFTSAVNQLIDQGWELNKFQTQALQGFESSKVVTRPQVRFIALMAKY